MILARSGESLSLYPQCCLGCSRSLGAASLLRLPTRPPSPERPSVPHQTWGGLREPGRARRGAPHSPSERNWGGSWRETSPQPGLPPSGKCQETGGVVGSGVCSWAGGDPGIPEALSVLHTPPEAAGEEKGPPAPCGHSQSGAPGTPPASSDRCWEGAGRGSRLGGSEARLHLPLALFLSCSLSCSLRLCGCQSLSLSVSLP